MGATRSRKHDNERECIWVSAILLTILMELSNAARWHYKYISAQGVKRVKNYVNVYIFAFPGIMEYTYL